MKMKTFIILLLMAVGSFASDTPPKGDVNGIVIFIQFADQTPFVQAPYKWYNRFNYVSSPMNNFASLKGYLKEVSYDSLNFHNFLLPEPTPDSSQMNAFIDDHVMDYYRGDTLGNDSGYSLDTIVREWKDREGALLQSAINWIEPQVPFGVDFDADSNGIIDLVTFVVRGPDTSRIIHGRSGRLSSTYAASIHGLEVKRYIFSAGRRFLDNS